MTSTTQANPEMIAAATACAIQLFDCDGNFEARAFLDRMRKTIARNINPALSGTDRDKMEHALFEAMFALQRQFGTQRVSTPSLTGAVELLLS